MFLNRFALVYFVGQPGLGVYCTDIPRRDVCVFICVGTTDPSATASIFVPSLFPAPVSLNNVGWWPHRPSCLADTKRPCPSDGKTNYEQYRRPTLATRGAPCEAQATAPARGSAEVLLSFSKTCWRAAYRTVVYAWNNIMGPGRRTNLAACFADIKVSFALCYIDECSHGLKSKRDGSKLRVMFRVFSRKTGE